MIAWFRYARHEDAHALAATGLWRPAGDLPLPHGRYSVLMQWIGEGEPSFVIPQPTQHEESGRDE